MNGTEDGVSTIANLISGTEVKMVKDFPFRDRTEGQDGYVDLNPNAQSLNFVENIIELYAESNGEMHSVSGDIIQIGRDPICDIWIKDRGVSRHHATFFFESGSWYLRDENSKNKTYLNGIAVQPGKKYKLHIGDAISLGSEEFYLFKDYDTAHNYEIYDEYVEGGTYYQCKRCGFKVYAHAIQMESLGYGSHVIIPPCRSRKYTLCSCGKIVGDGRNGTCICSDGKPRLCPCCGLQIDGHHTCKEALEIDEMVKRLHGNEPQKEKRKITKRHILAWCILGIMGIFVAVGVWFLIFGV